MRWITGTLSLALLVTALVALATGCEIATPLEGPRYDEESGVQPPTPDGHVIVALTKATTGDRGSKNFDAETDRVIASLKTQDGLIAWSVRKELLGDDAWTMTVWRDEAALDAFLDGAVHTRAVERAYDELEASRFARFRMNADQLPLDWERAKRILQGDDEGIERL